MEVDSLCQYLDWDSNFFGYRIARITVDRLSQETIEPIMAWCNSHHIDCLYFLADALDAATARLAEDNRFRFVDIRATFEKQFQGELVGGDRVFQGVIRLSTPDDIPALRAIARVGHRDSRFYYDSNFPVALSDALYETWIEKSCNGYANAVLVAQVQGHAAGYVSCHLLDQTRGQIGLVGVSADWQGNGLGQELVNESLRWFIQQGVTRITVVTQGRNSQAQRLYQRCGFLIRSLQLWYHRWFTPGEGR
jgi:dTDP-4-amino-4,6-dideoxy-D-galactose acyltransferase